VACSSPITEGAHPGISVRSPAQRATPTDVSESGSDKAILVVDGSRFSDLEGFAREFSTLLKDWTWNGNLDAFDDILRGGFGTSDEGFVLRWTHSDMSRKALGWPETIKWKKRQLKTCHSDNRARIGQELESARRHEGQTLFDIVVEIIRNHGPGGREAQDGVDLELV
jgi:Barstar (barnase inhibitor)